MGQKEYGNSYKEYPTFRDWDATGKAVTKIMFWSQKYDISFQFWGYGNNNVFIEKDGVELASFGGEGTPYEIMVRVIEWCEKSNPSTGYPANTQIYITNPQP